MRITARIAALLVAALVPMTASADQLIGSFVTSTFLSPGGCSSAVINRGIGAGFRSANVQLTGFSMQYTGGGLTTARAQNREAAEIRNVTYSPATGNVSFTVMTCHHDDNRDDDFNWFIRYTVLAQF
jgi:hypothetical protein